MSTTDAEIVTITLSGDVSDRDTDEIVAALNQASLDAVVGPAPGRMGLPGDLAGIIVEIPLTVLGTVVLTSAGSRLWRAVVTAAQRRRSQGDSGAGGAAVAICDPGTGIRFDLTLDDLADDRLLAELARLGEFAKGPSPAVMRWDRASAGWRAHEQPGRAGPGPDEPDR